MQLSALKEFVTPPMCRRAHGPAADRRFRMKRDAEAVRQLRGWEGIGESGVGRQNKSMAAVLGHWTTRGTEDGVQGPRCSDEGQLLMHTDCEPWGYFAFRNSFSLRKMFISKLQPPSLHEGYIISFHVTQKLYTDNSRARCKQNVTPLQETFGKQMFW
jgi:hypothetical protein